MPPCTTIRNLDERAFRSLKAWAVREGKTVGQAVSEAIRAYLAGPGARRGTRSLEELRPEPYREGSERLSEEIDAVVYGI
jgi:hypothetical protein